MANIKTLDVFSSNKDSANGLESLFEDEETKASKEKEKKLSMWERTRREYFFSKRKMSKKRRNRMGSPSLFLFFILMVQCEHGKNVDFSGFSRCPEKYTFLDTFVGLQFIYRKGHKIVNTFLKKIF